MAILNVNAKELHIKVLYCGAEAVGKKSTLKNICNQVKKNQWLSFPFEKKLYGLILPIGKVLEHQTYFHVYHLNHQTQKENQILAKGTDGFIFMASLEPKAKTKNQQAFLEMEDLILKEGKEISKVPLVLQYHKKDLKLKTSLNEMRLEFNKYNSRDFESSREDSLSLLQPLKYVLKLCLLSQFFSI